MSKGFKHEHVKRYLALRIDGSEEVHASDGEKLGAVCGFGVSTRAETLKRMRFVDGPATCETCITQLTSRGVDVSRIWWLNTRQVDSLCKAVDYILSLQRQKRRAAGEDARQDDEGKP